LKLSLTYDRAGRSEGIAYVTYESSHDAKKAIREFDGANAKGMGYLRTMTHFSSNMFKDNQFD
jgi:RNA recognition motif-containing protein